MSEAQNQCSSTEGCARVSPIRPMTESEADVAAQTEATSMRVELLQARMSPKEELNPPTAHADMEGEMMEALTMRRQADEDAELTKTRVHHKINAEASSEALATIDGSGNKCLLCGRPKPERTGGKFYSELRQDCGNFSTFDGPKEEALHIPAIQFSTNSTQKAHGSNGFCELNYAKSCADAIVNKDYLYWAKSMNMKHSLLNDTAAWDARYCHVNGFLDKSITSFQHDFEGMLQKAKELCDSKYAKYGIEKLTFLDMMKSARYDSPNSPTLQDAERLAAWNCAMGDLGCDLALCAYSFCDKGNGELGIYDDCKGWHPVHGMPGDTQF